ncbi:LysR family transcriptional regulator [Rhodobium gokarnense]|uniref:DNA-binding transcriptional LysR family regulator n=1 Tax=Rhodobium gokarnense TaxID=364296 RepID=A0ABT3HB04_9HYPH|nr:LysR family transcriptional regulator [Rhodobium gokarnense]MCW2307514.1 DNA-binding transcriptional LysR family regulator [Rhodobium gokarnense]
MRVPNFRHLRAFREVAATRSVSGAAGRVHLSQPAITQAIAKLEEQLGTALFERRSDGMIPTETGLMFLERSERALGFIRSGAREAVRIGAKKGGRGFANFDQLLTTAQLRALVAVSRAGNFSLAARNVGISQPTLHRAARDLERLSGLALFSKTSQGIELTPAAVALSQAVKLAFAELEQGFSEIEETLGIDAATIVVGALPLPRAYVLPAAINLLTRERPEVRVSVVDGPYNDLFHDLRHGEIDLLVGALRDPVPIDDVSQETLFSDPLLVVARTDHPLAGKARITLDDLAAYPWAVPRENTPTRAYFDRLFSGRPMPASIVESSSMVLIRELLLKSDRLTLTSAHQIRHERNMGLLAPLDVDLPEGMWRPIGITLRRGWRPTVTQNRFLDCLREAGRLSAGGEAA